MMVWIFEGVLGLDGVCDDGVVFWDGELYA